MNCSHKFEIFSGKRRPVKDSTERLKKAKDRFLQKKAAQLKHTPTIAESIFARKLQEAGIEFIDQWIYNVEGFAGIVDFYIPKYHLLIEVDGGYHTDQDQQVTDAEKDFICDKILHRPVLRLTNNQALYLSIEQILVLVKEKSNILTSA